MKILNNIQKNKEIIPKKNIKIEIDEDNKDVIKNSKQDNKKGCC